MGFKRKRGTEGNAVQFMTRNQALKKLQLKLADFRKLCIYKGIHPREPKKKVHGQNKTYYHVKDINFLAHEPVLNKLREQHAHSKKVHRAKAKENPELAKKLLQHKPGFTLDHLVKERYPTFLDALRDLDDPLTMTHLFGILPSSNVLDVPGKAIQTSRRLSLEFDAYVSGSHALRKVFVSVKGYYYQADIMGQTVTWLVPHEGSQVLPTDVDYRVMMTFLDFYTTLLKFVNFKLYHSAGVRYPPAPNARMDAAGVGLGSLLTGGAAAGAPAAGAGAGVDAGESEQPAALEGGAEAAPAAAAAAASTSTELSFVRDASSELSDEAAECRGLFAGLTFFLAREVPREQLLFVIRAFGGRVGWEGELSPIEENDESITHQVVDRPSQSHRFLTRTYVQPQWVFDSVNFRVMAPAERYAPGAVPPPHLSPFVSLDGEEEYVPDYAKELRKLQEEANAARLGAPETLDERAMEAAEAETGSGERTEALSAQEAERRYNAELEQELKAVGGIELEGEEGGEDGSESDEEGPSEAAAPLPLVVAPAAAAADAEPMEKIMMTRKNRKLYESLQKSKNAKRSRIEQLERRKSSAG